MANRNYTQFRYSLEKAPVDVYATVLVTGSNGDPQLQAWKNSPFAPNSYVSASNGYKGVRSVVQNGTGDYTFTFGDNFQRLLGAEVLSVNSTGLSGLSMDVKAGSQADSVASASFTSGAKVNVVFSSGSVATNPAVNSSLLFHFTFSNSSAQ